MSKAGQNTVTGISFQADIALLYLLKNYKKETFSKIIVEGSEWEDFTICYEETYSDYVEDHEVKWHEKPVTFALVKEIIEKEMKKSFWEKDCLVIIAKKFGEEFREYFERLKNSGFYFDNDGNDRHFNKEQREFLFKHVRLDEISEEELNNNLIEHFSLLEQAYLNQKDKDNLISSLANQILKDSSVGGEITRNQLSQTINGFVENIVRKSESFHPKLELGDKIFKLADFLKSPDEFNKLNNDDLYLTPISSNFRYVHFISSELGKNADFGFSDIEFFIEKVLLKNYYMITLMDLFENKLRSNNISLEQMLSFLSENYKKIFKNPSLNEMISCFFLRKMNSLLESGLPESLDDKVFELIQNLFRTFKEIDNYNHQFQDIEIELVRLLVTYNSLTFKNKEKIIELVFGTYNFAIKLPITNQVLFPMLKIIKDFILVDVGEHYSLIKNKIFNQFSEYNLRRTGMDFVTFYESSEGKSCIYDHILVDRLFKPLFSEYYMNNKDDAWGFIKTNVVEPEVSDGTLLFLKRSVIPVILQRISDETLPKEERDVCFDYLQKIQQLKNSNPDTSEVIFYQLSDFDLLQFGTDRVIKLIENDSMKYGHGFPSNSFSLNMLLKLIQLGVNEAEELFLSFIRIPEFLKNNFEHLSNLLSNNELLTNNVDFIIRLVSELEIEILLENSTDSYHNYNNGEILLSIVRHDIKTSSNKGKSIIDQLLKDKSPSKQTLNFLTKTITELGNENPLAVYNLFYDYLVNPEIFITTFRYSAETRHYFTMLGMSLIENNHLNEAKQIVELCINDPDPTPEHSLPKLHRSSITIDTVRGTVPFILSKIASEKEMDRLEYALEKIEYLLDLDGKLAKKLGYGDIDYYVMSRSLLALRTLGYSNLDFIRINNPVLADKVKNLALESLRKIETRFKDDSEKPEELVYHSVLVFDGIWELSAEEMEYIWNFIKHFKIEDGLPLLIRFIINCKNDEIKLRLRDDLKEIASSKNNLFKEKLLFILEQYIREPKLRKWFLEFEDCYKLFFNEFEIEFYHNLYFSLTDLLKWEEKYVLAIDLTKKALLIEVENKSDSTTFAGFERESLFEIIFRKSQQDFLDTLYFYLSNYREKLPNHRPPEIGRLCSLFKTTDEAYRTSDPYKAVEAILVEIIPEEFINI